MADRIIKGMNPILSMDYPDLDVIRVGDTYYMVSTTMHFMPGAVILRSYDLINWEILTYVYDELDNTPEQRLEGGKNCYGAGMWAASLRYHKGTFYVCFVANDTHKTYIYQAKDICGPWKKQYVEGFYHDCSLLFDDDDRVYIVYGNTQIWLTELKVDLTGPKPGGLHRMLVEDTGDVCLGYEGSHIQKINGKYYLFLIHWPNAAPNRRTEACFMADSLTGEFKGRDVMDDDMGYRNAGSAQGGIVDTPEGDWYAVLFRDMGAAGRIPVLVPVHFEDDFPVFGIQETPPDADGNVSGAYGNASDADGNAFDACKKVFGVYGKVPAVLETLSIRPDHRYEPLYSDDDFCYQPSEDGRVHLKKVWQWNHTPDNSLWTVTERPGHLRIRTGKKVTDLTQAVNMLTQRTYWPYSEASVLLDAEGIKDGDYAGLCMLQSCYGMIAVTKEAGTYYLVMQARSLPERISNARKEASMPPREYARIPLEHPQVRLKAVGDFHTGRDEVRFFYEQAGQWIPLGPWHKMYFRLDHFTGCRFGLFIYSTREMGGIGDFSEFCYKDKPDR